MNRKDFLKSSTLLGAAALVLPTTSAFAKNLAVNTIDKLVDANGNYIQQTLPYSETFLEPYMDAETLHLHYTFHHGGAIKGANKDLQMIKKALDENNLETVDFWTKKLSYHFSSHILHSIFWTNLTNKSNLPKGELLKRIEKSFGSFDRLKVLIAATAKNVDGNGWGIVAYQPFSDSLVVLQCENHEKLTQWGAIPILVIDVWEHAYYIDVRNARPKFLENFWQLVNWDFVAKNLG